MGSHRTYFGLSGRKVSRETSPKHLSRALPDPLPSDLETHLVCNLTAYEARRRRSRAAERGTGACAAKGTQGTGGRYLGQEGTAGSAPVPIVAGRGWLPPLRVPFSQAPIGATLRSRARRKARQGGVVLEQYPVYTSQESDKRKAVTIRGDGMNVDKTKCQEDQAGTPTGSYFNDLWNASKRHFRDPRFFVEILALIGLALYTLETRRTNNLTETALTNSKDQFTKAQCGPKKSWRSRAKAFPIYGHHSSIRMRRVTAGSRTGWSRRTAA